MARCGCTSSSCSCQIIALDTACIDTTVTGNGASDNPFIISSVPVVNPAAANLLSCDPSGLMADLTTQDSNCVDFTGVGTPASPLIASLIISPATSGCISCSSQGVQLVIDPDLENQLSCGASGLFVPAPPEAEAVIFPETLIIAASDELTEITTGTAKVTFRMPFAMTLSSVRASLTTASSSGLPTFDINEGGTTILSTPITIDVGEKTSTTATTAPVISDTVLADDAEITVDFDVAGTGATGVKIYLIGTRT